MSARGSAAPRRTNTTWWIAGAVVLAIGVSLVLAAALGGGGGSKKLSPTDTSKLGRQPAPASLVSAVTSVPKSVIDAVGGNSSDLPGAISGGTPSSTKPALLFIGAEFCPYCAGERWAIVNALSRFGTFSGLKITYSSAIDTLPNTPTFSFYGSAFTSSYVEFTPVEVTTNEPSNNYYKALQTPTAAQQAIWDQYDPNSFPFMYFDGRFALKGPSYDVSVLQGKTHDEIAAALSNPRDPIAKGVIGAANGITAAVCSLTHDQPVATCSDPAVKALEAKLGK